MKASSSASNSSIVAWPRSQSLDRRSPILLNKRRLRLQNSSTSALACSLRRSRSEVRWCLSFFYQSTVFSLNEVLSMFRKPSYKIYKITKWNCKKKIDQKMRPIVVAFVVQSCLSLTSTVHSVQNNVPQQSQAFSSGIKKLPDIYWNTTNPM